MSDRFIALFLFLAGLVVLFGGPGWFSKAWKSLSGKGREQGNPDQAPKDDINAPRP